MKELHGLQSLTRFYKERLTIKGLADLLMSDLGQCRFTIYGCLNEAPILLAELQLQADSLAYEMFDQRIDLTVVGKILRNDCVPLTYRLQGELFSITGRCSMIPRVCGVDLYLNSSYSGCVGDDVLQKFQISVAKVFKGFK